MTDRGPITGQTGGQGSLIADVPNEDELRKEWQFRAQRIDSPRSESASMPERTRAGQSAYTIRVVVTNRHAPLWSYSQWQVTHA